MYRLFPTLNIYVLWLVDVTTVFISSCFVLHYQTMPGCMGMGSILDCCNIQLNHWLTFIPIIVGVLFICLVGTFLFLFKKTKKFIAELALYQIDCYESIVIEAFQRKHSVKVQIVEVAYPLAFTHGFIRPHILVSTGLIDLLQTYELEAVLEHEYYHYQNRDPFKLSIGYSLARVFSFLPISQKFYTRYLMEKEINADTFAIREVGMKPVASALYKLMTNVPPSSFAMAHFQNHSFRDTNTRIEVLLTGKYKRPSIALVDWMESSIHILLIVLLIAGVSFL
ncbi:peptidase M48 family protein [Bacillus pseudomycoides]|uniref:M56 family metallopeptidase n=1 Tax=Bacillus TaxID=1386 RepID=UPI0003624C7B|nr:MULTISPECIES: M56 family metallopeptidase [Bacillus]AIK37175.1 peptidase M48 family protein [Bacillus pseudomycoides]AJI19834.1 peptidase M48 family protein [Bacillus pseudomycoides]PEM41235.1 hypothetical protein CN634_03260 [Bacillus pseudomycoides]